jgi:hypothetical protein
MTEQEQIVHLANLLDKLVSRFSKEYEMTYASIVGVLQMKIHLLCAQAKEQYEEL